MLLVVGLGLVEVLVSVHFGLHHLLGALAVIHLGIREMRGEYCGASLLNKVKVLGVAVNEVLVVHVVGKWRIVHLSRSMA